VPAAIQPQARRLNRSTGWYPAIGEYARIIFCWMVEHAKRIEPPVMIGIRAAFDLLSN
jgi:hypothetical protein